MRHIAAKTFGWSGDQSSRLEPSAEARAVHMHLRQAFLGAKEYLRRPARESDAVILETRSDVVVCQASRTGAL
jgi:hypothetical protein